MIVATLLIALLALITIALQSSYFQTLITSRITERLSERTQTKISIEKVKISFFKKVILKNVLIESQDSDTLVYTGEITAKIDSLKLKKKKISFGELAFNDNRINIGRDSSKHFNFSFLLDSLAGKKANSPAWTISCSQFGFHNSNITFTDEVPQSKTDIFLFDLNLNISDFTGRNDSLNFKINNLDFNDGKRLALENLSAKFEMNKQMIRVDSLHLKSRESLIENAHAVVIFPNDALQNLLPDIDFRLDRSEISLMELSQIIPSLRGMDQNVKISGRIYGDFDDLKGKGITFRTGSETRAELDFYINGLKNPETMYMFFDLKEAVTTFKDISSITLPSSANISNIRFPESFYESNLLTFTGNFSGFLSDFVTFGTLESEMGVMRTDISVIPKEKGTVRYRGKVSTFDFKLGELLRNSSLGSITFNGEVDGNYNYSDKSLGGLFKGFISSFDFNNYRYRNIDLDGFYLDRMFDGLVSINDPNLKFDFKGQVDLNNEEPDFNFNLALERFLPGRLNWGKSFPDAEMAFTMNARFSGNKIDNLDGSIQMEDGFYSNRNGSINLKNMQLSSNLTDSLKQLQFSSDYFDLMVKGKYNFQGLLQAFSKTIKRFIPAMSIVKEDESDLNRFEYELNAKNINDLTTAFYPGLRFEEPFLIYGKMDEEKADFELAGSIPGFEYKDYWIRNLFLGNKIIDNQYSAKFTIGEILHRKGRRIYDVSLVTKAADNKMDNRLTWRNRKEISKLNEISSHSVFSKSPGSSNPQVSIDFQPASFYVVDSLWNLNGFSLRIDSSDINISNLAIENENQKLIIDGTISKYKSKKLSVDIRNLDLNYLSTNLESKKSVEGLLNCSIKFTDIYNQPLIVSDLTIDNFEFENQLIGDVNLRSFWDNENSSVNASAEVINNGRKTLEANGLYQPENDRIEFDTKADSLSVALLGTVIKNAFSEFRGYTSGNVRINGSTKKLKLDGALYTNAGLTIDYTQCRYTLNDLIYFKGDTIEFDNIEIEDLNRNKGKFNGTLVHDNFKNMQYNLSVNSPNIMVLNTTPGDNEQFYGQAFANCKLAITGKGQTIRLEGQGTSLRGTAVNISMDYENDLELYDFFRFKTNEETEKEERFLNARPKGNFSIGLTVEATPDAKVQLIYNSRIGDIIRAQGEGILLFEMDKDWNISLSGDYNVTQGDYLFTLQNVVNKRFAIDQGGSIIWSGDPYNAIIDITAIYKLKASLNDLMMENYLLQGKDIYQRIPVECKILLSEELTNPMINFEIDFPEEDESLVGILQQFINTEEELNKQILSLIVMGKFYTPEYLRGQFETQNPNTLGTTASELFSNQLSNWLSQISNNVDVGFNYRPGNAITNDEIELALSTQIFNDRVTLNGNIGNNVNPESTNQSQIVGEFDMKVKLVPNGKIQFKAFNRSNNNLIYETAPYTQGIGLSFKEEYNTFDELLKKFITIFKKSDQM